MSPVIWAPYLSTCSPFSHYLFHSCTEPLPQLLDWTAAALIREAGNYEPRISAPAVLLLILTPHVLAYSRI